MGKSSGAAAEPSSAAEAGGILESVSFRGRKPRRVSMMSYDSQVTFDVFFDSIHGGLQPKRDVF